MRRSATRKKADEDLREQRRQQRHRVRLGFYPLLAIVVLATGLWLTRLDRETDRLVADTEARISTREVETAVLVKRLVHERKIREARENDAVRRQIYQRTVFAGLDTPPDLGGIKCNYLRSHNDPNRPDVFVNKSNCLSPLGYEPSVVQAGGASLQPQASREFRRLQAAMATAGLSIRVTSSYRNYADQATTYRYWLSQSSRTEADMSSALPGYSEHQTGLVVDIAAGGCVLECFAGTAQYKWMKQQAHSYGFIERYPKRAEAITGYRHESWHWRYIGARDASAMYEQKISTLEQYWDID